TFSTALPSGGIGAGTHLANDRVRKTNDAVDGQVASGDHAARPWPYQGRYDRLVTAGKNSVLRRFGRIRRDSLHRRCVPEGLAGYPRRDRGAAAGKAGAGSRRDAADAPTGEGRTR